MLLSPVFREKRASSSSFHVRSWWVAHSTCQCPTEHLLRSRVSHPSFWPPATLSCPVYDNESGLSTAPTSQAWQVCCSIPTGDGHCLSWPTKLALGFIRNSGILEKEPHTHYYYPEPREFPYSTVTSPAFFWPPLPAPSWGLHSSTHSSTHRWESRSLPNQFW